MASPLSKIQIVNIRTRGVCLQPASHALRRFSSTAVVYHVIILSIFFVSPRLIYIITNVVKITSLSFFLSFFTARQFSSRKFRNGTRLSSPQPASSHSKCTSRHRLRRSSSKVSGALVCTAYAPSHGITPRTIHIEPISVLPRTHISTKTFVSR